MAAYVPVLKGKPGELRAWRAAAPAVIASSRVVFEVVPKNGPTKDLTDLVGRMTKGAGPLWPVGAIATVDTGYLDQSQQVNGLGIALWTARELLQNNVLSIPVMRHDDPAPVLADIAAAAQLVGRGVCLRVGSSEDDPNSDMNSGLVAQAMEAVQVAPADIDLLIDMWTVESNAEVGRALQSALTALQWAAGNGPWRSVTLLSGAFPVSISQLPTGRATPLRRWDAELYNQVVGQHPALVPDFGDYGPASPVMPTDVPFAPLPNLRYAAQDSWQVYREQRALPGNDSFYTLCGRVVQSNHWFGAPYSWGDGEIDRCSRSIPGPGAPTEWRSYGTSHHLAHVLDRLATTGAP